VTWSKLWTADQNILGDNVHQSPGFVHLCSEISCQACANTNITWGIQHVLSTEIVKVKFTLWRPKGGVKVHPYSFLNLGARWGWVVKATPRLLYPREGPGTYCVGGWVGPRAGLYGCGKSRLPPAFYPRTLQPVASRYTDWAILAPPEIIRTQCKV